MQNNNEYEWLRTPSGEVEFPGERWHKLTFGGLLWNYLTELVRQRAPQAKFEQIRRHLEDWQAFAESMLGNKEQWERACRLVELAQQAAQAADGSEVRDEQLDRACFPNLSAWEWEAFCDFRGRSAERSVTLIALLVYQNNKGFTAKLTLELFKNGTGGIYKSPAEHAFLTLAPDFEGAIDNAKACVKSRGANFDGVDVRWRLERHDGKPLPPFVEGPSMGAAFAIGLSRLFFAESTEDELDLDGVAVTAQVDKAGNLDKIGLLFEKLEAIANMGQIHTVVVAAKQQDSVLEPYLREDAVLMRVLKAQAVDDAMKQLPDNSLPRRAVLKKVREECATLDILGWKQVPMETHYQVLLLREVKREKLPRFNREGQPTQANNGDQFTISQIGASNGCWSSSPIYNWRILFPNIRCCG
ncbi:hypothetical protein HYR99_05910 [Candidatus Poribacteria bacterium]|nr:hypothetical protein [Candidatus Poribacteria bacterium]